MKSTLQHYHIIGAGQVLFEAENAHGLFGERLITSCRKMLEIRYPARSETRGVSPQAKVAMPSPIDKQILRARLI